MGTKPQRKAASERKIPPRVKEGRPTGFRPEFIEQARQLCKLGATEYDLSEFFQVNTVTIWQWRTRIPEFANATRAGKIKADDRAELSLYHRAIGYTYHSEKVFQFQGEIIRAPIVEHIPPDVTALSLWLRNRRPDQWRDRSADQNININVTLADLVNLSFKADLPELPAPKVIENEGDS